MIIIFSMRQCYEQQATNFQHYPIIVRMFKTKSKQLRKDQLSTLHNRPEKVQHFMQNYVESTISFNFLLFISIFYYRTMVRQNSHVMRLLSSFAIERTLLHTLLRESLFSS